jgi:hypothetical protein
MSRLERLHNWVHHNFWKYQLITKGPLVIIVLVIWTKI